MADIASIFGGAFEPPAEPLRIPVDDQIKEAMLGHEIRPPDTLYIDGKIHRFASYTKASRARGAVKAAGTISILTVLALPAASVTGGRVQALTSTSARLPYGKISPAGVRCQHYFVSHRRINR